MTVFPMPAYHRLLHVPVIYWAVLTSSARPFTPGRSWDWMTSWNLKMYPDIRRLHVMLILFAVRRAGLDVEGAKKPEQFEK